MKKRTWGENEEIGSGSRGIKNFVFYTLAER
jgi:hypothetical protein